MIFKIKVFCFSETHRYQRYLVFNTPRFKVKHNAHLNDKMILYNKLTFKHISIGHYLWTFIFEDRCLYIMSLLTFSLLNCTKQIDSILPFLCSVKDHRWPQNVVRTSVTHWLKSYCATFLLSIHFDIICDLLLNTCMATWDLFLFIVIITTCKRVFQLPIKLIHI